MKKIAECPACQGKLQAAPTFFKKQETENKGYTIMLTNAEIEYMAKMPGALRAIEKQLTRIADALEKLAGSDKVE